MSSRLSLALKFGLAVFAAGLAGACGGGGGDDDLQDALKSVTDDQLALMVLSREQLGAGVEDFEIEPDGGFDDADDEAEDTFDPDDTGAELKAAGYENSYGLGYTDSAAIEEERGLFNAGTSAVLFDSDESASAFLAKQFEDFTRLEGEEYEEGLTLETAEGFDGVKVGDEARFVELTIAAEDLEAYFTGFNFRLGRLLGRGGIVSFDDTDLRARVEEIAQALEDRVKDVLRGDVDDTPIPIPTPSPSPTPPPTPPPPLDRETGFDILPEMVPQLEELPPGFEESFTSFDTIEEEADLFDDPDAQRRLESWEFLLGYDRYYLRDPSQGTFDVSVEVWLHESEAGAMEAFLDGAFEFDYPEITEELLPDLAVMGDESEVYRYAGLYTPAEGEPIQTEGYAFIIRVGQFVAILETFSPAGLSTQDEALGLAQVLENRMRDQATR